MSKSASQLVSFEWKGKEVSMEFHAEMVKDDFGVPGSPVWWTAEGISTGKIYVDASVYNNEIMFAADYGLIGVTELDDLAAELIDDDKWEMEEDTREYERDCETDERWSGHR